MEWILFDLLRPSTRPPHSTTINSGLPHTTVLPLNPSAHLNRIHSPVHLPRSPTANALNKCKLRPHSPGLAFPLHHPIFPHYPLPLSTTTSIQDDRDDDYEDDDEEDEDDDQDEDEDEAEDDDDKAMMEKVATMTIVSSVSDITTSWMARTAVQPLPASVHVPPFSLQYQTV